MEQPGGQGQGVVAGSNCSPVPANPPLAPTLDLEKSQAPQAVPAQQSVPLSGFTGAGSKPQAVPAQQSVPSSGPTGAGSKPPVSLSESMLKLQEAVEQTQDPPCAYATMKKPAAAKSTKSSTLKRPASKTMAVTKSKPKAKAPAKPQMSKQDKREALLRIIPPALKKKFANGCARCRERKLCTISRWRLRGFEI